MTLVTDTSNANLNSYATLDFIKAFNEARGQTLPDNDQTIEQHAIQAFDEIESFRARYEGTKTENNQPGQFPRKNLTIDGIEVSETEVPLLVMQASAELVFIRQSIDFREANTGAGIIREKVGPIETTYAVPQGSSNSLITDFPTVEALLEPMFKNSAFTLSTLRI